MTEREHPIHPLKLDQILAVCAARRNEPGFIDLCLGASRFNAAALIDLDFDKNEFEDSFLYGDSRGMESLRNALSRLYEQDLGVELPAHRLLITDGASEALHIAFLTTLAPGDEIILPGVCFPVYKILAQIVGTKCVFAPVDDRLLYDVKSISRFITKNTKTILINSPSNPAMGMLTTDEIGEILSLGLNVISDEVYSFLVHDGIPETLLKFSGQHFVVNSFSKSHAAAGIRVGHLVFPEKYTDTILSLKGALNICTSLPSQILANRILSSHAGIVSAHRNHLRGNFEFVKKMCTENGLRILGSPRAGFFCAIDAARIEKESAFDLAMELIKNEGIAVCPSTDFGTPDPMFIRLNYSVPRAQVSEAIARISPHLKAG